MTPIGDETRQDIAEEARKAAEKVNATRISSEGRREEERHNRTQDYFGWAILVLAGVIVVANIAADLMNRQRPHFDWLTVLLVVALAAFGGALLQRVKVTGVLDRLPFKRKDGDA